jgi:hypothetical protein
MSGVVGAGMQLATGTALAVAMFFILKPLIREPRSRAA